MNNPLVSIIVPTYNTIQFLDKLIGSVQRQSYKDWELLVIDDHSTDGTEAMVASYVSKDSRIRYFKRDIEPKGAQTCRNLGFDYSSGKYIVFFDSDDLIAEFCIEQRVRAMERNSQLDFGVFPATSFLDTVGDTYSQFYGFKVSNDILALFTARILPFVVWNNIYKRESLVNSKIRWDEKLTALQDSDFNISTLLNKLKFQFFDEARIDYYWRTNPKGITSSLRTGKKNATQVYFFCKLCTSLRRLTLIETYEKEIVIQLLEMLKIFSISNDKKSAEEVLNVAKQVIRKKVYLRVSLVYKLYLAISSRIPFEKIILSNIHKHKLFFLAERERVSAQIKKNFEIRN